MKLVLGDKVIENAKVNVGKSRLCEHDMEGRIKYWVEIVIPASEQHGGYAVRQLFGQDPNIGAREVVLFEVGLTPSQAEQIRKIAEADLLAIRNGNNPTTIYSVNLYEDVPKGSPSVLRPEIAVETVKPSGEYLGCVQWFHHGDPDVIIRRDSRDLCTYYKPGQQPLTGRKWHDRFSQWIADGSWKEISQDEALRRIAENEGKIFGVDWASGPDTTVRTEVMQMQLLSRFNREGIWLYAVADELRVALVQTDDLATEKYKFPIEVPCVYLCDMPRVKWPVHYRHATMPRDYGKQVMYFSDFDPEWGCGILRGSRSTSTGQENLLIEKPESSSQRCPQTVMVDSKRVFIVDPQTEGF